MTVVVENLEKLRPCGRLEKYSTARHHLGYFNNVGLTAIYIMLLIRYGPPGLA
jgi:hypothetical protein